MKQHQRSVGKNDEWLTPEWITAALGDFDLDPCSPVSRPWATASRHLTIEDDGLHQRWAGRVWLNPPFNRKERPKWMEKMAYHRNGVMLIPAATETEAFVKFVWGTADSVLFVRSRPHFHYVDGGRSKANCGTALALVSYSEADTLILRASGLGTVVAVNGPPLCPFEL